MAAMRKIQATLAVTAFATLATMVGAARGTRPASTPEPTADDLGDLADMLEMDEEQRLLADEDEG